MKTGPHVHSRRGFYLIGLLIVIAILLILGYEQMGGSDGQGGSKFAIDRSKDTACMANRSVFASTLTTWRITHQGEAVTLEAIAKTTSVPTCPMGGKYSLSADGSTLYCSIHFPDPAAVPSPTPAVAPKPTAVKK
jgi:hypothetical protein